MGTPETCAEAAAAAGVNVLCEKSPATAELDGEAMIDACRTAGVKLVTAYRLHFEKASLEPVRALHQVMIRDTGASSKPRARQPSLLPMK